MQKSVSPWQKVDTDEVSHHVACRIRDLTVTYQTEAGEFPAVSHINLDILSGRITAIIGESGSGKSTLGLTLLNGISAPGRIVSGSVSYADHGKNALALKGRALRNLRGAYVGTVFQASQNTMNPVNRVRQQIVDLARSHGRDARGLLKEAETLARTMAMNPQRVLNAYPHQLSGGMRQRIGLIMALVLQPQILLLDEPTTALDLLTQSRVLEIIKVVQQQRQLTTVLITHDIGVVAEVADQVAVMYAGSIVEQGPTRVVLGHPRHPYTHALARSMPRLTGDLRRIRPLHGSPPDLTMIPSEGCVFRDRCRYRLDRCERERPPLEDVGGDQRRACYWEGALDD